MFNAMNHASSILECTTLRYAMLSCDSALPSLEEITSGISSNPYSTVHKTEMLVALLCQSLEQPSDMIHS